MALRRAVKSLVAVCQVTFKDDKVANIKECADLVLQAKNRGCKMIFFPECTDFVPAKATDCGGIADPPETGTVKALRELASQHQMWISFVVHNKVGSPELHPYNTHFVVNDSGNIVASYDKLHQFNIKTNEVVLSESKFTTRGEKLIPPVETPIGSVGLNICYDLRFPELSRFHQQFGADILTYPSAFTVPTGMAHWEVLLRARAIESQSYVIAAAQFGAHSPKRSSYGHAMVVDPYGFVVAQSSNTTGIIVAEIDLSYVDQIRKGLNVFTDRRTDVYNIHYHLRVEPQEPMHFGSHLIPKEHIFYQTQYSFAFVNISPVVPGHILVAPNVDSPISGDNAYVNTKALRDVHDLSPIQNADLFATATKIAKKLSEIHKTQSYTLTVQNGPAAGQTVDHVHIHVLPRHETDFGGKNDQVYTEIEKPERPKRSFDEMKAETDLLRAAFSEL